MKNYQFLFVFGMLLLIASNTSDAKGSAGALGSIGIVMIVGGVFAFTNNDEL